MKREDDMTDYGSIAGALRRGPHMVAVRGSLRVHYDGDDAGGTYSLRREDRDPVTGQRTRTKLAEYPDVWEAMAAMRAAAGKGAA